MADSTVLFGGAGLTIMKLFCALKTIKLIWVLVSGSLYNRQLFLPILDPEARCLDRLYNHLAIIANGHSFP
jgi:hypothetical protein